MASQISSDWMHYNDKESYKDLYQTIPDMASAATSVVVTSSMLSSTVVGSRWASSKSSTDLTTCR